MTYERWRLHRQRVFVQRRIERSSGPKMLSSVYGRLGQATDGLVTNPASPKEI